ncbi:MAG: MarR family transcriptional regulator [Chloroflexota bacterium]|nr:MAG: MarR family transcriptional regulator [Chloroflexota bacterium]
MATEISAVKQENALAPDEALLESLVGTLRRLMWFERNWLRQILAEYDLDIAPFMLLLHLLRHEGICPIGELSQAMELPNATTTGHVDRLEQKRLVRREYGNAPDRRQVRVHVTAQGKTLARRVREQRLQTVARALQRLPARDRARFVHLLVKFMDELELTQ